MTNAVMSQLIRDAYAHPQRRACFYSADLERTGSQVLDALPQWDWTVAPSRRVPDNTTCLFALALGAQPVHTSEGKLWVAQMFPDDATAYPLVAPDVRSGHTGLLLGHMERMVRELPPGERIREPDIQSPLGVAELLCGQGLYAALIERGDAVLPLLETICDFEIAFVREMRTICGDRLNGAGFPFIWSDAASTLISDDTLSLLSPKLHRRFSLPWVNRFADAVGPIHYHSCSWYERHFANIGDVRNVRTYNWNLGNSDDPHRIIAAFSGKAVLAPHLCLGMHRTPDVARWGRSFADEVDLLAYVLDGMCDNTSLHLWLGEFDQRPDLLERLYTVLHQRGFSPQAQGVA
jgi:hypothetical protein